MRLAWGPGFLISICHSHVVLATAFVINCSLQRILLTPWSKLQLRCQTDLDSCGLTVFCLRHWPDQHHDFWMIQHFASSIDIESPPFSKTKRGLFFILKSVNEHIIPIFIEDLNMKFKLSVYNTDKKFSSF